MLWFQVRILTGPPTLEVSRPSRKRRSRAFDLFYISAITPVTNLASDALSALDFQGTC